MDIKFQNPYDSVSVSRIEKSKDESQVILKPDYTKKDEILKDTRLNLLNKLQ